MYSKKTTEFNNDILRLIVCPVTGGKMYYDKEKKVLVSKSAKLIFPVKNGIPILIRTEAETFIND